MRREARVNTTLPSLPSAFPIKGRKGHWSLCFTSLPLSPPRKVPESDSSWQLSPTTSKHTPQIHRVTPSVGIGGQHKADTLLGRYTSRQGHIGRETLANAGAGPTHICSGTHHVRTRHPILTPLNDSGKAGTGHIPDEAELDTRLHHTLGRGQAGAGGGLGSRPGCRDGGSGRQAGRAGASCSSQHNRRLLL